MNILITICARAGSKGVKSKNTRNFCGRPLVEYTIESYSEFCEVYKRNNTIHLAINTDSELLREQINNNGIKADFIPRQKELANDVASKMSVIRDTMLKMENIKRIEYDVVIDLDLTAPLREASDIAGTVDELLSDKEADIAFSVTDARRSPYFNMVCKKENGYYDRVIPTNYTARQQVPQCFDMNASIYAYRRAYLISENQMRKAVVWKMKDTAVLDIDCEEDLELMELIADYLWNKKRK